MSENDLKMQPELELGSVPTLTLSPDVEQEEKPAVVVQTAPPVQIDETLSPEELKAVNEFAEKINLNSKY